MDECSQLYSRMAELLTLFSRHNPSLKAFLDTIDLASLRGSSENLSSDKHAGSADLVFEANLKDGGVTGLYVGIIAEHKSTNRDTERMAGIRSAKRGFRTIPNITTTSDFLSRWNSWMWDTPSTMLSAVRPPGLP